MMLRSRAVTSESRQWLRLQVRYPAKAIEQQIEGRVVCSFVVERDGCGSPTSRHCRSPDRLLTDEVRRVSRNATPLDHRHAEGKRSS